MSLPNWSGTFLCVLVGTLLLGCSSSSNDRVVGDAAAGDSGHNPNAGVGIDSGEDASASPDGGAHAPSDMTTGKVCTKDSDCRGSAANAPGINRCSNTMTARNAIDPTQYTYGGVPLAPLPTPICMPALPLAPGTGNCDPCGGTTPCDGNIHFCDGPDDPSSPGLCLPFNLQNPVTNAGICVAQCTFALDGSKPVGCAGNDTCVGLGPVLSSPVDGGPSSPYGIGYCFGTCEKDADCSLIGANWFCQTNMGLCTQKVIQPTKGIGTACTGGNVATSDTATGACWCLANSSNAINHTAIAGFCGTACIVGGAPCPTGYVCDTGMPSGSIAVMSLDGRRTMVEPGIAKQNVGAAGVCLASCTLAGDAGTGDAGAGDAAADSGAPSGQCPPNSTCIGGTIAGPDCQPKPM